jgi:hypothetical protein
VITLSLENREGLMQIIDYPFGSGDEVLVDEAQGTFTLELRATFLGNPQDVKLQFGIKTLLMAISQGITNPIIKFAFDILINLF